MSPLLEGRGFHFSGVLSKRGFLIQKWWLINKNRASRGGGLITAVNNKFSSVLIDLTSFSTQSGEVLGVKIWINKNWEDFRWLLLVSMLPREELENNGFNVWPILSFILFLFLATSTKNIKLRAARLTLQALQKSLTGSSTIMCIFWTPTHSHCFFWLFFSDWPFVLKRWHF